MKNKAVLLATSVAVALSAAAAQRAAAQEAASTPGVLEELVVTVRRVEERLQEVPIAVVAFSEDQLKQAGVSGILDLQHQVPNLQFRDNAEASGVFIVMRGQAQANNRFNNDGPLGIYLDGVNLARTRGLRQGMFDIERVEVLKGPQGTLYGRNTTGGAMNIISRKPSYSDGYSGFVEGSMGNYDSYRVGGALNLPFAENFAARIAVQRGERDGFGRQVLSGSDRDLDDQKETFVRASVLWDPTDNLNLHLVADWKKFESAGRTVVQTAFVNNPALPMYLAVGVEAGLIDLTNPATIAPGSAAALALLNNYTYANIGSIHRDYGEQSLRENTLEDYGVGLTATLDAGGATITSVTGYRGFDQLGPAVIDGTPYRIQVQTRGDQEQTFFSQELRINGELFDDRLDWVLGGYYSNEDAYTFEDSTVLLAVNAASPNIVEVDFENEDIGAFVQGGFAITDAWKITLGARYTEEEKAQSVFNRIGNARTPDPNDGSCLLPGSPPLSACRADFSDTWGEWSWLISTDFHITPDVMVYASASHSWRGGGQNSRGNLSAASFASFDPEFATNYELGLKADWLNHRLRTNLALFYTDYEDIQRNRVNLDPATNNTVAVLTNAAAAHIQGFDLELEARPTDGVTLRASVGYADPQYDEFIDLNAATLQPIDRSSESFENVSEWNVSLNGHFERPMGPGIAAFNVNWFWQDDVDYTSEIMNPTVPREAAIIDAYSLLNLRLSYRLEERGLEFALWGNNVLDEDYFTRMQDLTALGYVLAFSGDPATYGMEIRKRF